MNKFISTSLTSPKHHGRAPAWLVEFREQHREAVLQTGLPTRQNERWKYTDFSLLQQQDFNEVVPTSADISSILQSYRLKNPNTIFMVLVNGQYAPEYSNLQYLPEGMIVCSLKEALSQHESLVKKYWPNTQDAKRYPFASLNAASMQDGIFLYVPDKCHFAPLQMVSLATAEQQFITHPCYIAVFGKESKGTLVEEYHALGHKPYFMNVLTHMVLEDGAELSHYKIQKQNAMAWHIAHTAVTQAAESKLHVAHLADGAKFAREDLIAELNGANASCQACGFYKSSQDDQYIDHHIDIIHRAPQTHSEMLYKGILDKKSRAVFNGRLCVEQGAKKILAYQANHHLLLSKTSEAYSKPELEIYADDVKCKHGATTGQIDQDALFYLRSRGIDHKAALEMLLTGFTEEIFNRISPEFKHHLRIKMANAISV